MQNAYVPESRFMSFFFFLVIDTLMVTSASVFPGPLCCVVSSGNLAIKLYLLFARPFKLKWVH